MNRLLSTFTFIALICIVSCEPQKNTTVYPQGEGFFVLNEGNYLAGNGTVSFYSMETGEIYNDLFGTVNGRGLGDIPSFIAADGNAGYIVVNNSGTIEAVDLRTMESLGTYTGLDSPRQMVIYQGKGYVSSLHDQAITVIDLGRSEITGSIDLGITSEAMAVAGSRLFSANWSGGNTITVTDLTSEEVIKTITVGLEPESMAVDRNGKLWVLCTGGWQGEEIPRIVRINTSTLEKEAELSFRTVNDNPSSLTCNAAGDTLYYLDEGVRRMPVTATALPSSAYIPAGNRLFYKLLACPGGKVAVTDAIDYQQKGDLLIFSSSGELTDSGQAGIIPGFMLYRKE
ncbi:MAG: hypothetical protein QUS66_12995 [Bacteroidota bacterium]|jgi:YVTN family beta-propeller protein|nr:hypothetical protein [Bacteroidota bacterium]